MAATLVCDSDFSDQSKFGDVLERHSGRGRRKRPWQAGRVMTGRAPGFRSADNAWPAP
jgi:hypothetical protein